MGPDNKVPPLLPFPLPPQQRQHWVVDVNGTPTPDLDAFVAAVRGLPDGADARVSMVHVESERPKVMTLKVDSHYWPTWELRHDAASGRWRRHRIGGGGC